MDQDTESKLDFKNKLINFYKLNKVKVYISIIILLITLVIVSFMNYQSERKNKLIAERYVQAGLFLASNKKDNARDIYEDATMNRVYLPKEWLKEISIEHLKENETGRQKLTESPGTEKKPKKH